MENYRLYKSQLIQENQSLFINECKTSFELISKYLGNINTTWGYDKYNLFSITSSSMLFYKLYKELNYNIRNYVGTNQPLWLQCWLNFHKDKEVTKTLNMHGHNEKYHGYISIQPNDTTTIFKNGIKIKNQIGQIYIGPGRDSDINNNSWDHFVRIDTPSFNPRITLGFDISTKPNNLLNPSFIPLL